MRIATNHYQNQAVSSILETQATIAGLQEQASTGRRVNRPSDDPLAAAEAERLRAGQARNDIEKRMMSYARKHMAEAESTVSAGLETLQNARTLMIGVHNGAMSHVDRLVYASQLAQVRNELLDLANTRNSEGHYVFGGQGAEEAPFSPNADPLYRAQPGNRQNGLDISFDLSLNGQDAFTGYGERGDTTIFQEVDRVVAALTSDDREEITQALARGMEMTDRALERMSIDRSIIGEQMNVIDMHERLISAGELGSAQRRSELIDTDYASVISSIHSRDLALRAAMQTYSQISQLSMFNYL